MLSVFPGIDPDIECDNWEDFHGHLIAAISYALVTGLRPDYFVRIEKRVCIESQFDAERWRKPDLTITRADHVRSTAMAYEPLDVAAESVITPMRQTLPGFEVSDKFLVIRKLDSQEVVTVIEVLSPGNKRAGSDGRTHYLKKREQVLQSNTSLVEIDLLRGEERLPTVEGLPPGDFFAIVCRGWSDRKADASARPLNHRLRGIPIPLSEQSAEASLDLQTAFTEVYDRAGYDDSINYTIPLEPALNADDVSWAALLVESTSASVIAHQS